LKNYEAKYPIEHHIQSWTTDMWAVLWEYWKRGGETRIHDELEFTWATDHVSTYYNRNIFHLAGITSDMTGKFYKGLYTNKNVFVEYAKNPNMFDHVSPTNATIEYVNMIKEYVSGLPPVIERNHFKIIGTHSGNETYVLDKTVKYHEYPVWRSPNYIIFNTGNLWILTHKQYENEISPTCGGLACNTASQPYENSWNIDVTID
jgi:hypothetical protein